MAQQVFLEQELRSLLNRFSMENGSNTPDFILAKFLLMSLDVFNASVKERDRWYHFNSLDNIPKTVKTINL